LSRLYFLLNIHVITDLVLTLQRVLPLPPKDQWHHPVRSIKEYENEHDVQTKKTTLYLLLLKVQGHTHSGLMDDLEKIKHCIPHVDLARRK